MWSELTLHPASHVLHPSIPHPTSHILHPSIPPPSHILHPSIPHPVTLHPISHVPPSCIPPIPRLFIPHRFRQSQILHPTSHVYLKSCVLELASLNPQSLIANSSSYNPLSHTSFIPHPTPLHPKSSISCSISLSPISYITNNASYVLYPYSPYPTSLHAVSVHPKSHTSHPSIPYPASCIPHPVSAHPISHIPPPHATPLPADGMLHTGHPPVLRARAQAVLQLAAIQFILFGVKGCYLCRESRIRRAAAGSQEGTSNHKLTAPLTQSILILILEDLHLCLERQKVSPGGPRGETCPLPGVG